MKRWLYSAVAAALLSGCVWLPDGEPPEGNLVENPRIDRYGRQEIAEALATELSLYMLQQHPNQKLALVADATTKAAAEYALLECAALAGVSSDPTATLALIGNAESGAWHFRVTRSGTELWRRDYELKEQEK